MKRIFLTSGLVLCMACPAFAAVNDGVANIASGASGANCVSSVLETSTAGATANFSALWTPNISGAITLDSNRYASSTATSAASPAASPAADPTTLYSKYGVGIYSNSTATTAVTKLNAKPALTGYTYAGFYTGKAGSGTKVIDNDADASILTAAKTQVATSGGTATWYAHWTPNQGTINLNNNSSYTQQACGSGNNTTVQHNNTTPSKPTASNPATLYTIYNTGVYKESTRTTAITSLTSSPSLTGYTFGGYYTAANGGGAQKITWDNNNNKWTIDSSVKNLVTTAGGSTTLYAKWTPKNFKVNYNCGTYTPVGGSATSATVKTGATTNTGVTYDDCYSLDSIDNQCNTPAGYTFGGWSCNADLPGATKTLPATANEAGYPANTAANSYFGNGVGGVWNATSDITCTAIWKANTIKLTWSANGGSGGTGGSASCVYDTAIGSLPSAPTRTGYTFAGWDVSSVTAAPAVP